MEEVTSPAVAKVERVPGDILECLKGRHGCWIRSMERSQLKMEGLRGNGIQYLEFRLVTK